MSLSADIYCDVTGKAWSYAIRRHPAGGGPGVVVKERHGMKSQHNAETALEAAWGHFQPIT